MAARVFRVPRHAIHCAEITNSLTAAAEHTTSISALHAYHAALPPLAKEVQDQEDNFTAFMHKSSEINFS